MRKAIFIIFVGVAFIGACGFGASYFLSETKKADVKIEKVRADRENNTKYIDATTRNLDRLIKAQERTTETNNKMIEGYMDRIDQSVERGRDYISFPVFVILIIALGAVIGAAFFFIRSVEIAEKAVRARETLTVTMPDGRSVTVPLSSLPAGAAAAMIDQGGKRNG